VFSLDMQELLQGLGAKPEQIRKVMQTAEANRKKPVATSASMMGGGPPAGMMAAGGGAPAA
jgi:hypothetical protein